MDDGIRGLAHHQVFTISQTSVFDMAHGRTMLQPRHADDDGSIQREADLERRHGQQRKRSIQEGHHERAAQP